MPTPEKLEAERARNKALLAHTAETAPKAGALPKSNLPSTKTFVKP